MDELTIVEQPTNPEVAPTASEVLATEQTEAIAEAAVEVAQIEADKEVAIAEIQAETVTSLQADNNDAQTSERDEWQRNIETRLTEQEATNREILSTLQALREQPLPNPPERSESPEVMPESQEAPEPPPKPKRPHHRLI
jgi:hypothetical protein